MVTLNLESYVLIVVKHRQDLASRSHLASDGTKCAIGGKGFGLDGNQPRDTSLKWDAASFEGIGA